MLYIRPPDLIQLRMLLTFHQPLPVSLILQLLIMLLYSLSLTSFFSFLFQVPHVSDTMQHLSFFVGLFYLGIMPSGFKQVITNYRISFFNAEYYIYIYLCMHAQSLSHVQLFVTQWTVAYQAPLSSTISRSLLKFMSIESVTLPLPPPSPLAFNLSFPKASGSFPMSGLFASCGQSIGVSASARSIVLEYASLKPRCQQGHAPSETLGQSLLASQLLAVLVTSSLWPLPLLSHGFILSVCPFFL